MPLTRRALLARGLAGLSAPLWRGLAEPAQPRPTLQPAATPPLRERFSDLRRHFAFEYYPWYGRDPWFHWNQWGRRPPDDIASNYVPRLGAYDCRDASVLEQHARWIADSGAGAVNLSWWGRDSFEERCLPLLLDVLRDHDLKAAFHLEPYRSDRGQRFADDVLYLLREHGERRGYDALLLLRDADGRSGPVFKGFRTILPEAETDCLGRTRPVRDYTPDDEWRRQLDALRRALEPEFERTLFLADTLNVVRASWSGFDGIAVYDPFVPPEDYAGWALAATSMGLVSCFNANPGFDAVAPRHSDDPCARPPRVLPDDSVDFSRPEERERAAQLADGRLEESLDASLRAQSDPALRNAAAGFLLVYLNSFNEWHEGTAVEPMKDAARLTPGERAFGYHTPEWGERRLRTLAGRLRALLHPPQRGIAQGPERVVSGCYDPAKHVATPAPGRRRPACGRPGSGRQGRGAGPEPHARSVSRAASRGGARHARL
jgi:hypothetical protein